MKLLPFTILSVPFGVEKLLEIVLGCFQFISGHLETVFGIVISLLSAGRLCYEFGQLEMKRCMIKRVETYQHLPSVLI